jgi:hypothetical protein
MVTIFRRIFGYGKFCFEFAVRAIMGIYRQAFVVVAGGRFMIRSVLFVTSLEARGDIVSYVHQHALLGTLKGTVKYGGVRPLGL